MDLINFVSLIFRSQPKTKLLVLSESMASASQLQLRFYQDSCSRILAKNMMHYPMTFCISSGERKHSFFLSNYTTEKLKLSTSRNRLMSFKKKRREKFVSSCTKLMNMGNSCRLQNSSTLLTFLNVIYQQYRAVKCNGLPSLRLS